MGRVKGSGEGAGNRRGERRENGVFFSPLHLPPFALAPTLRVTTVYTYPPQSSTVIKSKMGATTIRTRRRFRPPKIRLHCTLQDTKNDIFFPFYKFTRQTL